MNILAFYLALSQFRPRVVVDSIRWVPGNLSLALFVYDQLLDKTFQFNLLFSPVAGAYTLHIVSHDVDRTVLTTDDSDFFRQVKNKLFVVANEQAKQYLDKHQVDVVHLAQR